MLVPLGLFVTAPPVGLFVTAPPVGLFVTAAPAAVLVGTAAAAPVVATPVPPVAPVVPAPVPPVACLSDVSGLNRCVSDEAMVMLPAAVEQPGVPSPVGQPQ